MCVPPFWHVSRNWPNTIIALCGTTSTRDIPVIGDANLTNGKYMILSKLGTDKYVSVGPNQNKQEGNIALEMKLNAFSSNGNDFSCFIANSPSNSYDMYMEITDDADDELIYKSNLIKVGYRIEEFTSSRHYEKGTYPVTVTFYQVEDDHKTEHNRVASAITLNVE